MTDVTTNTQDNAEREARRLVNRWAAAAAGIGWAPVSSLALAALDAKLVNDVAKAFDVKSYKLEEVTAAVGASVAGKLVATEALSIFPGVGWALKAAVAGVVTKMTGEALITYFRHRSAIA
jgi:uncharacterized protein (DUF697 family)